MPEPELPESEHQVWLDGSLVPAGGAGISTFDRGLTLGEGVFETIKATHGQPFAVRRHLQRLRRSAEALDIDIGRSDDELRGAIDAVIGGVVGAPRVRVRITVTGGVASLDPQRSADPRPATVVVAAGPFEPWPESSTICTVPWPWNERSPLAGVKTTSHAEHVLAQAHARRQGCDEAVFANTAGLLCEGAASNVFVVLDGRPLTPSLASGCLPGVTRELVLEITEAEEVDLPIDVLDTAEEVFLTSSTRDVQPVREVDGRDLGPPGPLTQAAAKAFAALAATTSDP